MAASGGRPPRRSLTLDYDSPATRPPPTWPGHRPGSTDRETCARHHQMPTRAARTGSEVPAPEPPTARATARPCSPATSSRPIMLRYSRHPFALQAAFPPSMVARDCHDYYGSSATPRRQQRTMRLPRTLKGSAGTAGTLPTFTHMPVGRVGAQLYPGGIATRYRNTARGLDRPNRKRSAETIPNSNRDRDRQGLLPPFAAPPASGPLSFTRPLRWPGRGLSPRPVTWRLVAQTCFHERAALSGARNPAAQASALVRRESR